MKLISKRIIGMRYSRVLATVFSSTGSARVGRPAASAFN
jgi:hypothetical protein